MSDPYGSRRWAIVSPILLFALMLGTSGCGRERQFEITSVTLERVARDAGDCNVIVKVLKHRNAVSGVTVQGQVKLFDVASTTNTLDASNFGGPAEIGAGEQKVFVGRAVPIPIGVSATYLIEVFHEDERVVSRGTEEPPISCPP